MSATRVAAFPTGTVINWAGASGAPAGWLYCFGQSLSRTQYSRLFSVLGTTFGAADANSFSVPDLRGVTPMGVDNMGGTAKGAGWQVPLGTGVGGTQTHQLSVAEMAYHTHTFAHMHNDNPAGGWVYNGANYAVQWRESGGVTGTWQPHNNMQPTIIMLTIIKT